METDVKWCTYGAFGKDYPLHIGLLEKQQGNSGAIRYAENQMYALEWWDLDYVVIHESLEDAILFLIKNNSDESFYTVKEYLLFKTAKQDIDWNKLKKNYNGNIIEKKEFT